MAQTPIKAIGEENKFVEMNFDKNCHASCFKYTLFYENLSRASVLKSFLAFSDFQYSKFLDSFFTFFSKIEQQAKESTVS